MSLQWLDAGNSYEQASILRVILSTDLFFNVEKSRLANEPTALLIFFNEEAGVQNTALDKNISANSDAIQIPAAQVNEECGFHNIIGRSSKMREVFDLVEKVADCDSTILLNGETAPRGA